MANPNVPSPILKKNNQTKTMAYIFISVFFKKKLLKKKK